MTILPTVEFLTRTVTHLHVVDASHFFSASNRPVIGYLGTVFGSGFTVPITTPTTIAGGCADRPSLRGVRIGGAAITTASAITKDTLQQVTSYFLAHASSALQAQQQAIDWIGQQVQAQASFAAYMDAFCFLTLISLRAVPLALVLRKVKQGGPACPL